MKNFADLGGCYPRWPSASVDSTLFDLQNSSYPTQPHSIVPKYPQIILRAVRMRRATKGSPMSWFSHGCHGPHNCSWARTHDDDDGVAQHGGHAPNNRLTETCSFGLPWCTSLILDIHVMINWHLSKQGICWLVSRNHIAISSVQLIEVTCFLKLTAD